MDVLAILFALASALMAALSTSVQHHAAETAPAEADRATKLLAHLLGHPVWLLGQALAVGGLVFHVMALHNGPISLVQPIVITGIVFAVPVRAAISHTLPRPQEMLWVLLCAAGLVGFLLASDTRAGTRHVTGAGAFAFTVLGLVVAAALVVASRRVAGRTQKAFVLGSAAGIFFGLVAVLIKMLTTALDTEGLSGIVTGWPLYLLALAGAGGVVTNQLSYRAARLSASMPVLNVVNVLLALAFGYFVFQEVPRTDAWALVVDVVALAMMATGLWNLAQYEETGRRRRRGHGGPAGSSGDPGPEHDDSSSLTTRERVADGQPTRVGRAAS